MATYSSDPRWIVARYAGTDVKGNKFAKGDRVFFYPNGKRIYAGAAADDAARDFEAARSDEGM